MTTWPGGPSFKLTNGIGDGLARAVSDEAALNGLRFSGRLRNLVTEPIGNNTDASTRAVRLTIELIAKVTRLRVESAKLDVPDSGESGGWFSWLREFAELADINIADDLRTLLEGASQRVLVDDGLISYLDSLERIAHDMALENPAVAIMSMARSKGLTRTAVFAMGIEQGVVPSARDGADIEEERRLLYVAMTRARAYLFLSMASRRTGPTARTGGAPPGVIRTRSAFLRGAQLQPTDGSKYIARLIEGNQ